MSEEEGPTYVIGKMSDLAASGALNAGEKSVAGEIGDLSELASQQKWGVNGSVLRRIMSEGNPIRDILAEPIKAGNLSNETGFLRAERNLLRNHGWRYNGGYWYPPAK